MPYRFRINHQSLGGISSRGLLVFAFLCPSVCLPLYGQTTVIDNKMHHIRNVEPREWAEFPQKPEANRYELQFPWHVNHTMETLVLRQYDVKQNWRVILNESELGALVSDEKDMFVYYSIPEHLLNEKNKLIIQSSDKTADDINVGRIAIDTRQTELVLSEATLELKITDENNNPMPGRITIVDSRGILQTVVAKKSNDGFVAIRPGYVYTGNGNAVITTASGTYTIYATRGFEYGVDSTRVELKKGDQFTKKFVLRKEVPTEGWISCDTHIHTYTHSGHGDASDKERALTIAGEGIELAIATDHNVAIELDSVSRDVGVRSYFTPVVGNEVTTKIGHFNIFPVTQGNAVDPDVTSWSELSKNLKAANARVIILNHGRDIHNGFRPFDPARHLAATGSRLDNSFFFPNAMEVVNSGSQQNDIMRLYLDWFGLLNGGHAITPVGSSDSHDVSRFFVGQARTFIRSDDKDAANIKVDQAVENFLAGKVMVSLGLLTKLTLNQNYEPGDLVPPSDTVNVGVEVLGPSWVKADKIKVYANGIKLYEAAITDGNSPGVKWRGTWKLPLPKHDLHLVAIADGPAPRIPYWPIAKPYQPSSPEWHAKVIGSSGAVWIDADKNGKRDSAYSYAVALLKNAGKDIKKLMEALSSYDEAVAAETAFLLWKNGYDLRSAEITRMIRNTNPAVRNGFEKVMESLALSSDKKAQ